MAKLTTAQATELVENGSCICYEKDDSYSFHKFKGNLEGIYYECATPVQHDLELDKTSTEEDVKAAFIAHFKTEEHKGTAAVETNTKVW